jgi:competence protein ComEA
MRVSEGQQRGALTFLMISVALYAFALQGAVRPVWEPSIPWGSQGPGLMAVEVAGDPEREGIFFLPEGTTAEKVLEIADIPGLNRGNKIDGSGISAGSLLTASNRGEVSIGEMAAAKRLALGLPINLNQASEEDLALIPGIGGKTAYRILELRKGKGVFNDLSDLLAVSGIKAKKLDSLKGYLVAGPAQ